MPELMMTRDGDRPPPGETPLVLPTNLRPLLGRWVNFNENTTGIRTIEINDWEGTPVVRVTGAGRPDPIDWGEVAGAAFSTGVGDRDAAAFSAEFHLDFLDVLVVGYLAKRIVVADAYSTFTDSSGRANYQQRYHFYLP